MKKLLYKLIVLGVIITTVSSVVSFYLLPEFWGHQTARLKYKYYQSHKNKYNTCFVGSSRIFRQVLPIYFDSLAMKEQIQLTSINMGVNSFPAPQSLILLEKLIEESEKVKYYFVELTPIYDVINEKLLNTPEYFYWYDLKHLSELNNHIWMNDDRSFFKKIKLSKEHFQSYLGRRYLIGGVTFLLSESMNENSDWLLNEIEKHNGYISFESALKNKNTSSENLAERRTEFLKDTLILNRRKNIAEKFNNTLEQKKMFFESPYLWELMRLIKLAENKDSKVFFLIPPRLESYTGYEYLLNGIPSENLINLSDPKKYPRFYLSKYSFDKGHLNEAGAREFTFSIFNEFISCIRNGKQK